MSKSALMTHIAHHTTSEWYTPPWLLERIVALLGEDFYDPCPASHGRPQENGLAVPWRGRVYCNPPYGASIKPWIRKATLEPAISDVVLLVPAYTDTLWFAPLWGWSALCFVRGRIAFVGADGVMAKSPPHANVLAYRGRRWRKFAEAFASVGPVVRTARAYEASQPQLLSEREAVTA